MRRGEQLNWIKNIVSTMNMAIPTHKIFLLTHPPIVGHSGKGTHQDIIYGDHDRPFVEWVNGEDSDYPEGQYVEAVFCGHTHENHIFYGVDEVEIDDPDDYYKPSGPYQWYETLNLAFSERPYYIETYSATKEG